MKTHLPLVLSITLAASAAVLLPAGAQTPAPVAAAAPDISVVTVLGRLPKRPSANLRRLSRSSASSCAYSSMSFADEITDAYLDHFEGKGRDTAGAIETADPNQAAELGQEADPNQGFTDTSPYGDAKAGGTRMAGIAADGVSAACGQNDKNLAAGRNFIARKDKSLTEAFNAYDARDYAEALRGFETAYNKVGWDEAALMLGNMYLDGHGSGRDVARAIDWYTKLANARLTPEHRSPYDPKQPERASPRVEAQVQLARLYMSGAEVPRDPAQARRWYGAANKLDYIPARFILGRMALTGYGGEKDVKEGVKLVSDAAEHGYAAAQFALARMYQEGDGVPNNLETAFGWYQQAAFNPRPDGKKPHAQLALARMFDQGQGTRPDPAKALWFYKAAAIAGHPHAQNDLATMFYSGQLVGKDLALARKLFIAAATQQQPDAMLNAGVMLFKGEGGAADPVQSYVWLALAARRGNAQAPAMAALVAKRLNPEQRKQTDAVLAPATPGGPPRS